jgi:hypothetical protein
MSFGKVVKAKSKASQAADSASSCSSPRGCSSCSSKRSPAKSASSSSKSEAFRVADDKLRKELKESLGEAQRLLLTEVPGSSSIRAAAATSESSTFEAKGLNAKDDAPSCSRNLGVESATPDANFEEKAKAGKGLKAKENQKAPEEPATKERKKTEAPDEENAKENQGEAQTAAVALDTNFKEGEESTAWHRREKRRMEAAMGWAQKEKEKEDADHKLQANPNQCLPVDAQEETPCWAPPPTLSAPTDEEQEQVPWASQWHTL